LQCVTIDAYYRDPGHWNDSGITIQQILTANEHLNELGKLNGWKLPVSCESITYGWSRITKSLRIPNPTRVNECSWACQSPSFSPAYGKDQEEQKFISLIEETVGWKLLRRIRRDREVGLLRSVDFDPWRRLGFFLWDEKKMAKLRF